MFQACVFETCPCAPMDATTGPGCKCPNKATCTPPEVRQTPILRIAIQVNHNYGRVCLPSLPCLPAPDWISQPPPAPSLRLTGSLCAGALLEGPEAWLHEGLRNHLLLRWHVGCSFQPGLLPSPGMLHCGRGLLHREGGGQAARVHESELPAPAPFVVGVLVRTGA